MLLIALASCGAPRSASEPPQTAEGLICSADLPERCGAERAECEAGVAAIVEVCAREMGSLLPADATQEMRERATGLTILCSIHVYRQRRALDGHPCEGPEIDADFRDMCTICSVAAGTMSVPSE